MTEPTNDTVVAPATPAVTKPEAPIPNDTMVPLVLSVGQINYILQVLGTRPLAESLDTFNSVKQQGDMALVSMRMGSGKSNGATPPGDQGDRRGKRR